MVFSVGGGPGVKPRLALTVCPIKVEHPEAAALVEWVLAVVERSPWNGRPTGVREWPNPGRLHEQPAVVVEAVHLVLGEIEIIIDEQKTSEPPPPSP